MFELKDEDKFLGKQKEKMTWKDVIAIAAAQFSILLPIAAGGILIMFLLLLFVTKVWLK